MTTGVRRGLWFVVLLLVGAMVSAAPGDEPKVPRIKALFGEPTLPGTDPLAPFGAIGPQFDVSILPEDSVAGEEVTLQITVKVPPGSHTYSMNPAFSGATRVEIKELKGLEEISDAAWKSDHEPEIKFPEGFNQEVEEFSQDVTFTKTFRAASSADRATISGILHYQICDTSCTPYHEAFTADVKLAPRQFPYSVTKAREYTRGEPSPANVTVAITPADAKAGEIVTLTVTLELAPGWHGFALSHPVDLGGEPTSLALERFQGLKALDKGFRDLLPYKVEVLEIENRKKPIVQHIYEGTVTWSRTFEVLDAPAGYGISGEVVYQICRDGLCLPADAVPFRLGDLREDRNISEMPAPRTSVSNVKNNLEIQEEELSFGLAMVYAFLGGLILNVMPCVLPVLAIKILSFVKQAGESRARILQLNLAYSLGVISVFLIVATLAVLLGYTWGGLFQKAGFNIFMACVVFAMGLSLLGVFEIPVPGLGGGGGQREGLLGAFLTGIFATFLAIPCSGPFMGATLGWSVDPERPVSVTYLVWGLMGVGMAFPYLLTGVFPQALKLLPKPGPWMVRFKEFSGFALMAGLIWIISTFSDPQQIVPLLVMLMGIAFGLWMIGNLYDITSPPKHKNLIRAIALLLTCCIVGYGVTMIPAEDETVATTEEPNKSLPTRSPAAVPLRNSEQNDSRSVSETTGAYRPSASEHELPWQPFSDEALQRAFDDERTVLVDFTARWCLICKKNEAYALNTESTLNLVNQHKIVTLYADFSDENDYIKGWLKQFKSISVPLTVIFPGGNPTAPILLRDSYSESDLLEKLKAAVESMETVQTGAGGN